MQDEFIDDQPPIGTLTPEARESLRLAMADTPADHSDSAKHTPGPWLIAGSNFVYALHDYKGRLVNRFSAAIDHYPTQGGTANEGEANARLIASSPDLLDALLQWQHAEKQNDEGEIANARFSRDAAIEQATGKGQAP